MNWQPIETAPKDNVVMLYRPTSPYEWHKVAPGKYNDNKFGHKPRPYWESWFRVNSVTDDRNSPPTHWLPLPEPPKEAIIKWYADLAQLEADKKLAIAKMNIDFAISLLKNPFKTLASVKYCQAQIKAIQTQVSAPPPELFMQTGGVVKRPADGAEVTFDKGSSWVSKRRLKRILKYLDKRDKT